MIGIWLVSKDESCGIWLVSISKDLLCTKSRGVFSVCRKLQCLWHDAISKILSKNSYTIMLNTLFIDIIICMYVQIKRGSRFVCIQSN